MIKKFFVIEDKIYRKVHHIFWSRFKDKKWSRFLYASYRHYKRKEKRTGREPEHDNDNKEGLFLTQEPNKGAGIGHQMGNWNAGCWYAKAFGVKYAYSGFTDLKWDEFLGFGEGEVTAKELLKQGYKKCRLPYFDEKKEEEVLLIQKIIDSYKGENIVFFLELDQFYQAQYGIMDHIRKKFDDASKKRKEQLIYDKNCLNIGVHIRRGDIVEGQKTQRQEYTKRWLEISYYSEVLKNVISLIPEKQAYKIYLFSQGKEEEFAGLTGEGEVVYCMTMPPRESFLHMARADILITSKSSFSYKAGLLSDGIRICPEDFWHGYPQEANWILAEDAGKMKAKQQEKLKKAMAEKIQKLEECENDGYN